MESVLNAQIKPIMAMYICSTFIQTNINLDVHFIRKNRDYSDDNSEIKRNK